MARPVGSVKELGKNRWKLVVNIGYTLQGKKKRAFRTVTASNETAARKELAKFIAELESSSYKSSEKIRFNEYVEYWKANHASNRYSITTIENYEGYINTRIIPFFKNCKLADVKSIHIQELITSLSGKGSRMDGKEGKVSVSTIKYIYRILRSLFSKAIDWNFIKTNPCDGVSVPESEFVKLEIYTKEESKNLLKILEVEKDLLWRVFISVALTTGLRRGEILALEIQDYNPEAGTLSITKSLKEGKKNGENELVIAETKTKKHRVVNLPSFIKSEFMRLCLEKKKSKLELGTKWNGFLSGKEFNLIFSNWDGSPFHPHSLSTRWRRFTKKKGVRSIRLHDLRHTAVSLLIDQGLHPKVISYIIGHAKIGQTMDRYGHLFETAGKQAALAMEKALTTKKRVKSFRYQIRHQIRHQE